MSVLGDWPVLAEVAAIAQAIGGIEVWCFGSVSRGPTARDVDLLVVYEERARVNEFRSKIDEYGLFQVPPLLDLICMLPAEVKFYDFLRVTSAIRIA
ncbi:nucleotidyltransferase domain-containing protein [Arthrobacter sp. L77]|uniref:nucleotidyltransferase domain-containing protein n=1 Tax=Arthrobacter sp. L77 TaxID=1496689 RepID=UPI0012E09D30